MDKTENILYNIFLRCSCAYNRITTPQWNIETPKATHYNLGLIYEGSGTFERNGKVCKVKKGDIFLFCYGDSKYMHTNPDDLLKLYYVNFHSILPKETDGEWSIERPDLPFDFITHITDADLFAKLINLFEKMCRIHLSNPATRETDLRAIFTQILILISFSNSKEAAHCSFRTKSKIDKAIEYMSKNYTQKITVSDLAAKLEMSPSHFSLMFKKVTGSSVIDYLIKLRISKAKLLLKDGIKVSDAATAVGFSDVYYFSKAFKKTVGISPSEYR